MQTVLVHQYTYVAADKTRSFVVLFDPVKGEEIDSRHFSQAALPLAEVARDMYHYVLRRLGAEINPEVIQYRCNVMGGWNLVKEKGGYKRHEVYNRMMRDERKRLPVLTPEIRIEPEDDDEE